MVGRSLVVRKYESADKITIKVMRHQQRFDLFREMYRAREFRLVFCADVLDCAAEDAIRTLERVVKVEKVKGGLDYPFCEPLVTSERRLPRTRLFDHPVDYTGKFAMMLVHCDYMYDLVCVEKSLGITLARFWK